MMPSDVILQWAQRSPHWENAFRDVLVWMLKHLAFVQDVLLREPFQQLVLFAFRRRHAATLAASLHPPAPPGAASGFEKLDYYIDPQSRQVLQFAALHALSAHLQAGEVLAPAQLLPQVSRVLLQTEERQAGKMLEAVAGALAAQMNAGLLFVDALLLATLAGEALGKPPEAFLGAFSGAGGTAAAARAAPALELAWKALRGSLLGVDQPTVVFIRSAEQLLCSSFEAHDAFQAAFGSHHVLALEGGPVSCAPLVLMGGMCVDESAAGLAGKQRPQRQAAFLGGNGSLGGGGAGGGGGGGEWDEDGEDGEDAGRPRGAGRGGGKGLFGAGAAGSGDLEDLDDELGGLGDLLLSLSKLAGESKRPNARKLLHKVFPTRVKLQPPPAGPAAVRHQQALQRDASEAAEEENYRTAAAAAASTGVALPPKSSGLYAGRALGRSEWKKVLSWAVTIETLQSKQRQLAAEAEEEAEEEAALAALASQTEAAAQAADGSPSSLGGSGGGVIGGGGGGTEEGMPGPGTPGSTGLRRRLRASAANGTGAAAAAAAQGPASGGSRPLARQGRQQAVALPSALSLAASLWGAFNPLHLLAAAAALQWRVVRSAGSAALWSLSWLPLVGGVFEQALSAAQLEAELRGLEAELEGLEQLEAAGEREDDGDSGGLASSGGAGSISALHGAAAAADGLHSSSGALRLSEASLRYGLGMLQRSSGSSKQAIEPSNRYEKRLLSEVLSPEDCGRGFSEVGALEEAKTALREAVQLPLKHPELFAGGTLARPSKGVLLFGPPGTGKTLVARAAAAECGAAFLALNTSSITSKWFGDSTKLLRAAFTLAEKLAPCVLFIDEVDALLGKRNSLKEHEALREMKNEMMAQWDGIRPGRERVMVLGATNRPFDLDEAVLRRFTHRIFLGLPDRSARAAILRVVLEGERLAADVSTDRLAELTAGYSGSDLRQLCVQAAMRPVRAFLESSSSTAAAARVQEEEEEEEVEEEEGKEAAAEGAGEAEVPVTAAAAGDSGADAAAPDAAAAGVAAGAAPGKGGPGSAAGAKQPEGGEGPATAAGVGNTEQAAAAAGQAPGPPVSDAASGSSNASAAAAASLRLVPRLDSLLRQAERIARVPRNPKTDLRPISMQDFEEALKEVGASVNPDSATIQELNEWNAQYGTTGNKGGVQSKRLSYYS